MEEPEQPTRPGRDRPGDPRRRAEHLYPPRREGEWEARQCRDRDNPDGEGPVEGVEPAEIGPAFGVSWAGGRIAMGYWRAAAAFVCLSAALSLMAFPAIAQTVVKIGLINSYTGFVAEAADQAQKAIDLYLKEHERDLPPGVKLELIRRDDTSNPEVGKRLAQELITREHVQLLTGIVLSPVAAAVAPLTAEAKVPLLISIAAAGVAIPRMSPYVARVTVTLWQLGYPIGKWAAEQGWKTGYTAVSDFIPGHDSEAAFTKGFTADGGQMIGTVRFPPNNPDFAPLGIITSGTYSVAGERPANTAFLAAWK